MVDQFVQIAITFLMVAVGLLIRDRLTHAYAVRAELNLADARAKMADARAKTALRHISQLAARVDLLEQRC